MKSEDYEYPSLVGSILFYSVPVLFVLGWLATLLFGDVLEAWIYENYDKYNLELTFNLLLGVPTLWILLFSIYILIMGFRSIAQKRFPPENFYIWFKLRIQYREKAKLTGVALVIFSFLFIAFVGVIIYGEFITYGSDL